MPDPEVKSRFTVLRKIETGRVKVYVVSGALTHSVSLEESPLTSVRRAGPPYLLALPTSGSVGYSQFGRTERVFRGDYVLLSQKACFELDVEQGGEALIVSIPAADLKGRIASIEDHAGRRFEPNQLMSQLLANFLRGVAEVFCDRHPPNPEAFATEIISLVALTLGAEDRGAVIDVRNSRYYLRRRIFEFIEANLGDQNLSPKKIAAGNRISQSYLYSLFNDDDTTVGHFVQTKRLQRAYEILVADPAGRRTVSEVAYEVGFKNVSHFSRSFSRHFHIAPRDARQTSRLTERVVAQKQGRQRRSTSRAHGLSFWPLQSEPALAPN
jgi:AraC-like DNA-binding protein